MKKLIQTLAVASASILLISGCSGGESPQPESEATTEAVAQDFPVEVQHAGGTLKIEKKPEKIVVLDMAALDTLDAIGAGDQVAGTVVKFLPEWLKDGDGVDFSKATDIGTFFEPDMEAIAKLNPDLVITGMRSAKLYDELSKNYTVLDASSNWEEAGYSERNVDTTEMLGKATGHSQEATAKADEIRQALKTHTGSAKDKGTALVVVANAGEISLHGAKSRWAPIFDVFGFQEGKELDADEGHKGMKISFETIKELNPDYIFVVDRAAAGGKKDESESAQATMDNELVNSTKAAKDGHIVYLSPDRWYMVLGGANNFLAQLDEVAASLK